MKLSGGTSYYPDHWDKSEWRRDMQNIKNTGLDVVRFGEFSWVWYEPSEGVFKFDEYDEFVDIAHEVGLKVVLCTPTAAAPQWLLTDYPEVYMLDQHGRRNELGRHMTSYNHPKARELAERAIIKLAERYKNHPALYAWQIDNEPTVGESADIKKMYDYNPYTKRKFKQYIKDKYKTLDVLNSAWQNGFWSRSYTDWNQIEPPLEPGIPSMWMDWLRFREKDVTDFIRWQTELLRSVKKDFYIGTNIPECGFATPVYGQNYWEQARGLDYVGVDIYALQPNPEVTRRWTSYSSNVVRSAADAANAAFWVSETQGGPAKSILFAPKKELTPDYHRMVLNEFSEQGAENVLFFLWRMLAGGAEQCHNGMTAPDGELNDNTACIKGVLDEVQGVFRQIYDKKTVYIHHSRDSYMYARTYSHDDTPWDAYTGWYHLLSDMGYKIDIIDDAALYEKEWTSDDVCLFPFTVVADSRMCGFIEQLKNKNVKVVLGYGTAYYDEYAKIEYKQRRFERINGGRFVQMLNFDGNNADGFMLTGKLAQLSNVRYEVVKCDNLGRPIVLKDKNTMYFACDIGNMYSEALYDGDARLEEIRVFVKDILDI